MKLSGNKEKERKTPKTKKGLSKGAICGIVAGVVVLMAAGAATGGAIYVKNLNTIYPNVSINGIEVGGLRTEEAAARLAENGYDSWRSQMITASLPLDYTLTIAAQDVASESSAADTAILAYGAGRDSGLFGNALSYLNCLAGGMALESDRSVTVDESVIRGKVDAVASDLNLALLSSDITVGDKSITVTKGAGAVEVDPEELTALFADAFRSRRYDDFVYEAEIATDKELDLSDVHEQIFREPVDAYYDKEAAAVIPAVSGMDFDEAAAKERWNAAAYGETVEIPIVFTEAEVSTEELESLLFRDCLSSRDTSLWGSTDARINNVSIAASRINGVVLMPGDEFDYNTTIGKRSAETGFQLAGAYEGGNVVQQYGGGICQVSSTLYYCTLYANLKVTARTCHMFPVGYLPAGLDATVSWGGPEYRFVNDREYPVQIRAHVEDHTLTVEIWGTDTDGTYVEMNYGTWLVYDQEYKDVCIGYKAQTYRSVFDADGNLLDKKAEALSYYKYHDEDIDWPEEKEDGEENENEGEEVDVHPDDPNPAPSPDVAEPSPAPTPESPAPTPETGGDATQPDEPASEPPAPEAPAEVPEPAPETPVENAE